MGFNVLIIRSGLDTGDGALHPMLSDASSAEIIAMDDYDGPNVTKVVATAVRVLEAGSELTTLVKLREVKIDIYITNGRLALACEKYDKGGGWVGFGGAGLLAAVTANAVSKARAASRSRGKVLVGHIRYPWLKSVGASSKTGFASDEAIRLEYSEKGPGGAVRKMLELTLPKNIDAALVAQDIAQRAAAYRLAHYPGMTLEQRAKFTDLSGAARLDPPPKKFAFQQMPTFFHVSAGTAFPHSPQSGTGPDDAGPAAGVHRAEWVPGPVAQAPDIGWATGPGRAHDTGWATGSRGRAHGAATGVDVAAGLAESAGTGQTVKFCTQCGRRTVEGDNFCEACGASVKN